MTAKHELLEREDIRVPVKKRQRMRGVLKEEE